MIVVTITERLLQSRNACHEGIALWRKIAEMSPRSPSGKLRIKVRWTIAHQLWAAVAYPGFYAWLRDGSLVPQLSMSCADLRGADLGGADLRGADLGGADLGDTNLRYANLRGADLGGADLRGANLRGADLGDANLRGADLGGAYLVGADLGDWERGPDGYARRKQQKEAGR